MHPRVDSSFTYLLPSGPGKEVQAYEMTGSDKSSAESGQLRNLYVLRIKMRPGDTIYAARRGLVTEVEDQDGSNDAGGASAGRENYIEIIHADCSFGHYGILRKNSALVKPGQAVKPGQPIGLVGGDQYGRGSDVRFSVYYNREEDGQDDNKHQHTLNYIILQCWTKGNGKGRLRHGAMYWGEFPSRLLNGETVGKGRKVKAGSKRGHSGAIK
jgi:murein DD-endopeptidase MepM/ murein hydrolase activator NlpD